MISFVTLFNIPKRIITATVKQSKPHMYNTTIILHICTLHLIYYKYFKIYLEKYFKTIKLVYDRDMVQAKKL